MAEKNTDPSQPSSQGLDLSSLSGLDFGPNWTDGNSAAKKFSENERRPRGDRPRRSNSGNQGGGGRDRRSGGRPRREGDKGERQGSEFRGRRNDRGPREGNRRPQPFEPTVKIDLYPQDDAFDALVKRLRASARTYELFDITKLLLEKPERYMVVVSPKVSSEKNDSIADSLLYYSVPGHLPFASEAEALNYVFTNHMENFFEIEEVEVEPPSGNFQVVNRCGVTGELLGPPNYHRYQQFLQQHHNTKIGGMSFERFQSKIESSKEQEDIDAWLESMKKSFRYTLKNKREGDPEVFETFESARQFLLMNRKEELVGSGESIRFAGRDIERLPRGDIRRSVESYIEQQKHFPLDTANNIRGRLRRHKFAVYKKGSKGVSYVCAVKRRFRESHTTFTDSIRGLIEFIEKHPNTPASKLPKLYIGIDTEKQHPEVLKMTEESSSTPDENVETATDNSEASAETAGEPLANSTAEETPQAAEKATSTEAQPKSELSEPEQAALRQLMLDLRWLITEGYVTEYGDGRLFAPPPMPESKKTAEEAIEAPKNDSSDTSAPATPSE